MNECKIIQKVIFILVVICVSITRSWADSWKEISFADPTIFVENGKYYLTGTRNQEPLGFSILESTDLKHWTVPDGSFLQLILRKGDRTYGEKGFWAPQYFKEKGTYYFTYTANEQTVIASSKSVFGPFRQKEVKPIDASAKNIDSFLFKDDNGKYYLYHVRFNKGNYLWVAEFDIKKGSLKPETLKQCMDCTDPWEKTSNYKSAPVMEGPTVMKWDGVYYLFYSANHFMNIDYSVGYATASSPLGPWKKHPNSPIIHRSLVGENGSGHGDVFKGLDGKYYYVYHVHHSDSIVQPRKTRIVPLILKKGNDGIYNVAVDKEHVIKPMWK
ncbi:glycoside hydrolase family 43 protein [Bacteroides sp. AN502(2024)]|uniref:glycoside hydrolase family 43 protein n=1 Tax=Bacteroides sp. AN502(2024) TaxID=3160599 RepID=UPI00351850D3